MRCKVLTLVTARTSPPTGAWQGDDAAVSHSHGEVTVTSANGAQTGLLPAGLMYERSVA